MTEVEQLINTIPPEVLRDLFEAHVFIDSDRRYLLMREAIAEELMRIARNPAATKDCRTRALHAAKQFLNPEYLDDSNEI